VINAGAINDSEINGSGIPSVYVTPATLQLTLSGNVPLKGFFVPNGHGASLSGGTAGIISGQNATPQTAALAFLGRKPNRIDVYLNGAPLNLAGNIGVFGVITKTPPQVIGRRYFAVVTGADDGLSDAIIPLSTLSIRQTLGKKSSANISVASGDVYAAIIQERPNGTLLIHDVTLYNDGTDIDAVSEPFTIMTLTSSQGAKSYGININLAGSIPFSLAPTRHTLHGVSMIATTTGGIMRVRCAPISDILPGDLVVLPDKSEIQATKIVKTITSTLVSMEISDG